MARPRQPIELIEAKGKKHLTKKETENRKKQELKVEPKKEEIVAPEYLTEKLKNEFYETANKLLEIGIMTELDNDCLARYLMSKNLYLKYTSLVTKEISKGNITKIEKYMSIQDKAFKQCRSSANDLGLTISSRCKLVMPQTKEPEKQNKFTKFKVVGQ